MVVADVTEHKMKNNKSVVKICVSDSDNSNTNSSDESENDEQPSENEPEADSESNAESTAESDCNSVDAGTLLTNEGWADSVSKILGSTKPKNKKTLVLSRAKKYSETIKKEKDEKPAFEVIGEGNLEELKKEELVDCDDSITEPESKKIKHDKFEKPSIRIKPNILEKDRERLLSKIATKGVVQLFNAVRNQQRTLAKDIERSDLTEGKKEKILKKFDKRAFLDTLMGQTKSVVVDKESEAVKNEMKAEDDKPKWSALRDDFMMGAKMKDWDKESVDE